MRNFRHIVFVSDASSDDQEALKQALSIARNNNAALRALIVCPEFPRELAKYREKYEAALVDQLAATIEVARDATGVGILDVPVQIDIETDLAFTVRVVRNVLKHAHDLVIKQAGRNGDGKGFKARDMELLRKCPCPLWLSRPISNHRNNIKVAVAIDPLNNAPEGHDLSLRLLQLSRALADTCNGELSLVSCWDFPLEDYLRDNLWINMAEDELFSAVVGAQNQHRAALDATIRQSGIAGKLHVHQVRGPPDEKIPQFIADNGIDILVMGTVARTGIPGFILGNTAENILQTLQCSLVAAKPNGFVSPIKAYP